MEHCKSCGKEIVWLIHERTGKRAPIEAAPNEKGNVIPLRGTGFWRYVVEPEIDKATHYRVLTKKELAQWRAREPDEDPLYVSHFATCAAVAQRVYAALDLALREFFPEAQSGDEEIGATHQLHRALDLWMELWVQNNWDETAKRLAWDDLKRRVVLPALQPKETER